MSSSRVGPARREVGEASTLLQQPLPSNVLPTTSARRARTPVGSAASRPGTGAGGLNVTPGRAAPVTRAAPPGGGAALRRADAPAPLSRSPSANSTATTTAPNRRGASVGKRATSSSTAAQGAPHAAAGAAAAAVLPLAAADPIPLPAAPWEADGAWVGARAALLGLGGGPSWSTDESLAAAEMTVAGETHLARLAAGRIARQETVLQLLRDERAALEGRVAAAKEAAAGAEAAKLQLARAVRGVEAEALQARMELRQHTQGPRGPARTNSTATATSTAEGSPFDPYGLRPTGADAAHAPHTIIRTMLKHQDASYFERRILSLDVSNDGTAVAGVVPPSPLTRGFSAATDTALGSIGLGDAAARAGASQLPLTTAERLQRTEEVRKELEASVRATRFAVESRAAELEAVLGELDTLHVQMPGPTRPAGAFEYDSSEGYRTAIHDARELLRLHAWLKASLPLVQSSVDTRITMSAQTRQYTKQLVDALAAANHAADDTARQLRSDLLSGLTLTVRADRAALIGAVTQAVQAENQRLQLAIRRCIEESDVWRSDLNERTASLKAQLADLDRKLQTTRGQRSRAMI